MSVFLHHLMTAKPSALVLGTVTAQKQQLFLRTEHPHLKAASDARQQWQGVKSLLELVFPSCHSRDDSVISKDGEKRQRGNSRACSPGSVAGLTWLPAFCFPSFLSTVIVFK